MYNSSYALKEFAAL